MINNTGSTAGKINIAIAVAIIAVTLIFGILLAQKNQESPTDNTGSSFGEKGIIKGTVSVGPVCPVEEKGVPCDIPPEVFTSREVVILTGDGTEEIARTFLSPSGAYQIELPPGKYLVDIGKKGVDFSKELPKKITILPGETVEFNFSIDTGIR
jgi:hypothetical protein